MEIFVPILEVKFNVSEGRSNCSAEISGSIMHSRLQISLDFVDIKNTAKSIETGSHCFADLFPSNIPTEQLDKYSLLDAVIYEAAKDGEIDVDEREILKNLFALLNLNKKETLDRIDKIKSQVRSDNKVSEH